MPGEQGGGRRGGGQPRRPQRAQPARERAQPARGPRREAAPRQQATGRSAGGVSGGRDDGSRGRDERSRGRDDGSRGRDERSRGGSRTASGGGAARGGPRTGTGKPAGPRIPADITADQLDPAARAELRTLPKDLADSVARYLVAAGLQEDPEQAYLHAREARRLAARVGVVREAAGIAAYRAGHWADALAELRAARRLTGRHIGLPLMADSERALGRLDRALAIVQDPETRRLDRATQIELKIVESGIRRDQGMAQAAVLALHVPELTGGRGYPWSARLFYAYADALADLGRTDEARDWFARAAAADAAGETDAADRYDELDEVTLTDLAEDGEDQGKNQGGGQEEER